MFIPLHDGLPLRHMRTPVVTWGMIGLCTLVFAAQSAGLLASSPIHVMAGFGLTPAVLFGTAVLPDGLLAVPPWATPVTNVFLHVTWLHLIGNMLFLWVFGDNVEDAMGHVRFGLFLLWCGLAGSLAHAFMNPTSDMPLVGASGAVSGVIAAYLILYPNVRVLGLVLKAIPLRLPAVWALGAWIALQVFQAIAGHDANVGWWAHLGGLVAGALALPLLVRPGTLLLGRDISLLR